MEVEVREFRSSVVDIPLIEPMRLPFGIINSRPSGVLELNLVIGNEKVTGYGEGATLSQALFTDDSGETIGEAIKEVVNYLKLQGPQEFAEIIRKVQECSFTSARRYPTARMTVEMALLDAYSNHVKIPMRKLLGVQDGIEEVPFGKSVGGGTKEEVINSARESIATGAKKIKLKISPSTFTNIMSALHDLKREGDCELMVDANGSFDPFQESHLQMLYSLDGLGLIMIEEPVSRVGQIKGLDAVHVLRGKLNFSTPICLDDCLVDFEKTVAAIELGLADIVNIKPGRIGSIIKAVELADFCKNRNKQIMVGGMLEATPGRSMTTILAAFFETLGFTIPGDISLPQERLSTDMVSQSNLLKYGPNGGIVIPKSLGWGFGQINF